MFIDTRDADVNNITQDTMYTIKRVYYLALLIRSHRRTPVVTVTVNFRYFASVIKCLFFGFFLI